MVREDDSGVDFGLWQEISPSQLVCPLDVHVERVARKLGLLSRKQALERMDVSGTSPHYGGLFKSVARSQELSEAELAAVDGEFPEVWKTTGLVKGMVVVD